MKQINLDTITVEELKVMAYDLIINIEKLQKQLVVTNQVITQKLSTLEVKEEVTPEE